MRIGELRGEHVLQTAQREEASDELKPMYEYTSTSSTVALATFNPESNCNLPAHHAVSAFYALGCMYRADPDMVAVTPEFGNVTIMPTRWKRGSGPVSL